MGKQVMRNNMINSWNNNEKNNVELSNDSTNSSDFSSSNSSSSSDFMDDVSSSNSSSNGPLFELSDLMDQLPIKRGISKYYQGKSQSFTSLANVENLEDLAKKENKYMKKIKLCKSFCVSPKATISKKNSYSSSLIKRNCSNNFMANCSRLAPIPLHKDF